MKGSEHVSDIREAEDRRRRDERSAAAPHLGGAPLGGRPGGLHPRGAHAMSAFAATASRARARRSPGVLLVLVCMAQLMVILDVSIVNVALPSIKHGLSFSTTGLQWVVNAYTLTFAGFLLLGGRASDLLGRRSVFLAGTALFSAARLVGGAARREAW